jgi:hypothetical protein
MGRRVTSESARDARQLTAILPNGRTIWLRVDPPLAPGAAADHVARLAERIIDRRDAASAAQRRATARLSARIDADVRVFSYAHLARTRALRRRLAAGDMTLDARLSKARDDLQSRIERQIAIDRENVRRLRRRDFWDKILLASSLPLFAAYGQRGSPFGTNNLTLTLLLLIFLAGDSVVEALFGSEQKSKYAVADADAWSYLAPIGNVLGAWWLLGDRQHQRFVTGVTTVRLEKKPLRDENGVFVYRYRAAVALRERIAKDHFEDFETFKGVPAVATIGRIRFTPDGQNLNPRVEPLEAKVVRGELRLTVRVVPQLLPSLVPTELGEIDVAWMVDTDKPGKQDGK